MAALRKFFDSTLLHRPGEAELTPSQRDVLFKGHYFGYNYVSADSDRSPYAGALVGTVSLKRRMSDGMLDSTASTVPADVPFRQFVEGLNTAGVVARVKRIERVAGFTKGLAVSTLVLAGAGSGLHALLSAEVKANPQLPKCEQLLTGDETLAPAARAGSGNTFQECVLEGRPYVLVPPTTTPS